MIPSQHTRDGRDGGHHGGMECISNRRYELKPDLILHPVFVHERHVHAMALVIDEVEDAAGGAEGEWHEQGNEGVARG